MKPQQKVPPSDLLKPAAPTRFVGIDPGVTGWIAVLGVDDDTVLMLEPIPMRFDAKGRKSFDVKRITEVAYTAVLPHPGDTYAPTLVAIEEVTAGPVMSKHATCSLCSGASLLHGVFAAVMSFYGDLRRDTYVHRVRPGTWQLATIPHDRPGEQKALVLEAARERFPSAASILRLKKNQGAADALMIAAWLRKSSRNGTLPA